MSEIASAFQKKLLPGEQLLFVVEDLYFSVLFVPNITPEENYSCQRSGSLCLTNRRIIAILSDGNVWKWFHFSAINSLTERPLNAYKPSWPYQAIMIIPGGMGLVVQTQNPKDVEHATQLQNLLVQGFMKYGVRRDDDGAMAAIIAHEERRRREAEQDKRK